jgi:hypothetical protein
VVGVVVGVVVVVADKDIVKQGCQDLATESGQILRVNSTMNL